MGQANNSGRQATLDEKKRRAAGRQQNTPEQRAIKDAYTEQPARGKTGGAFGRENRANRGSAAAPAKDSHITTARSKRPARKRG